MKDALFLILGSLISAWAGIATMRYFKFRQTVRGVVEDLTMPPAWDSDNPTIHLMAQNKRQRRRGSSQAAFEDQGQLKTAAQIKARVDADMALRERLQEVLCVKPKNSALVKVLKREFTDNTESARQLMGCEPCWITLLFGGRFYKYLRETGKLSEQENGAFPNEH